MGAETIVVTFALLSITGPWGVIPNYPLSGGELKSRAASYFTDGGKYLGGVPKYDNELELYECTGGNATACLSWTAREVKSNVLEAGRCSCQFITNSVYSSAWIWSQLEVDSAINWAGSGDEGWLFEREVESTQCSCETDDDHESSGNSWASWACLERDPDGDQEREEYQCARASSSGEYCDARPGVSESSKEVEVSARERLVQRNGVGVFSYFVLGIQRASI